MTKLLPALIADLKFNLALSPWAQSLTAEQWREEVSKEAEELIAASAKSAMEESGDVLMDLLTSILASEARGDFTLDDVINSARRKLRHRKPWLFTGATPPSSKEEEMVEWEKQKAKETK